MDVPSWYVITGTTSSGKSRLIDELAVRGYQTVPELARVYIDRARERGISTEELRSDEKGFQDDVLELKKSAELVIPRGRTVFFDRGIPDTTAYYNAYGWDPGLLEIPAGVYRKVFLLEPLDNYERDYARKETPEQRLRINSFLRQAYEDMGCPVIYVPKVPIEQRVELVLSNL